MNFKSLNSYDANIQTTAIPRPIARRQHSSPAGCITPINLSESVSKLSSSSRTSTISSTNPFLNGSLSISEDENESSPLLIDTMTTNTMRRERDSLTAKRASPRTPATAPVISTLHSNPNVAFKFFPDRSDHEQIPQPQSHHPLQHRPQSNHRNPFVSVNVESDNLISLPSNGNDKPYDQSNKIVNTSNDEADELKEIDEERPTMACAKFPIDDSENTLNHSCDKQLRNRSLSDLMTDTDTDSLQSSFAESRSLNPFIDTNISGPSSSTNFHFSGLHKTLSETYLEQFNRSCHQHINTETSVHNQELSTWRSGHGRTVSTSSMAAKSNDALNSDNGNLSGTVDMKRAMSCDSVTSESSVILTDLEPTKPSITGMLCIGLQYDG